MTTCRTSPRNIRRHDFWARQWQIMFADAGFMVEREVAGFYPNQKRVDLLVHNWKREPDHFLLLDIAFTHPTADSYALRSANSDGWAASEREHLKRTTYNDTNKVRDIRIASKHSHL